MAIIELSLSLLFAAPMEEGLVDKVKFRGEVTST